MVRVARASHVEVLEDPRERSLDLALVDQELGEERNYRTSVQMPRDAKKGPRTRTRTRTRDPEQSRRRMLDAAVELIGEVRSS